MVKKRGWGQGIVWCLRRDAAGFLPGQLLLSGLLAWLGQSRWSLPPDCALNTAWPTCSPSWVLGVV